METEQFDALVSDTVSGHPAATNWCAKQSGVSPCRDRAQRVGMDEDVRRSLEAGSIIT